MTLHHDNAPPDGHLTTDPTAHHAAFAAAFNSRDARAVHLTYEDDAVVVPRPGHPMSGPGRVAAVEHLLGMGVPIEARTRHTYVAGDIALLIVDWSVRGVMPDGTPIDLSGTAADVARRGPDGLWRYVIDNPYGTA